MASLVKKLPLSAMSGLEISSFGSLIIRILCSFNKEG